MEHKIGEIFEYNGEWHQCLEGNSHRCNYCDYLDDCNKIACTSDERSDDKEVYFKKLEKVGEQFFYKGKQMQSYRRATDALICNWNNSLLLLEHRDSDIIDIEIKQNKEDMEEDKLNLKPFDLQKAKAGKPVYTRDGRKARIICFDANIMPKNKNILALIRKDDESEYVEYYTSNGKFSDSKDDINDLMMFPEKKEGWVNIDWDCNAKRVTIESEEIYDTKEDALRNVSSQTHKDTVKIEWEE